MSSAFSPLALAEIGVQPFQDDLQGNIFRNVDGFYAKYFEDKPWSLVVQNKLHEPESAEAVGKLTAGVPGIAHSNVLADWLADFQALFFTVDQTELHFQTQPLNNAGSMAPIGLYFETSHIQSFAGNTRAFGEFHQDNARTWLMMVKTMTFRALARGLSKSSKISQLGALSMVSSSAALR